MELPVAGIAGLLAALVLGAAGLAAFRSRRRGEDAEARLVPAATDDFVLTKHVTATAPPRTHPVQAFQAPQAHAFATPGEPRSTQPAGTATMAPRPLPAASARLPDGPVPTGAARADLLERMIAARPDETNPFTSPKARRRRARIILQSREYAQREQAGAFDWRTYRPSIKRSDPATVSEPPLVKV